MFRFIALICLLFGITNLVGCRADDEAVANGNASAACAGNFVISNSPKYFPLTAFNLAQIVNDVYGDNVDGSRSAERLKELYNFYSISAFNDGAAHYMILVKKELIIVAFRGTDPNDETDVLANLDNSLIQVTRVVNKPSSAKVQEGYYGSMMGAVTRIIRQIYKANLSDGRGGPKPILIAGHSLGAGMATLFSYELERHLDLPLDDLHIRDAAPNDQKKTAREAIGSISSVYLFGAPKAGNSTFKGEFAQLGLNDKTFRIENINDIVAGWAPSSQYVEVGETIAFENGKRTYGERKAKGCFSKTCSGDAFSDHTVEKYISNTFDEAKAQCPGLRRF